MADDGSGASGWRSRFYWFGVYHPWRRLRRIGIGVVVAAAGAVGGSVVGTQPAFLGGLIAVAVGLWYAQPAAKRLLVPAPTDPERWKYAPLAQGIDWGVGPGPVGESSSGGGSADEGGAGGSSATRTGTDEPAGTDGTTGRREPVGRWLDVGSGTGRALVSLADRVPDGCRVTAVDPYDDRVILGNGGGVARRNARRAGVDVSPVRGDAAGLPVGDDTQDVVTACRLLHDLSRADAEAAVSEARRVLAPDGQFGVVELPITHEETDDPLGYWESLAEDGGFRVTASGTVERRDTTYCYLICELDS